MSERVRSTPGDGQQVKVPVPRVSLTTSNHQETKVHAAIHLLRDNNHILLGMKRKAPNVETNLYRLCYRLDASGVGWKSEELNVISPIDAIHTTRSGLPPGIVCVRRFLIPIGSKVHPSRTILFKSLDAVGDGNASCPIELQPSGTEIEFVLDPEGVTNEVVETAVYLQEA